MRMKSCRRSRWEKEVEETEEEGGGKGIIYYVYSG